MPRDSDRPAAGAWLTDLDAHAVIVGIMRRKHGAGAYTQILPAGHAQGAFPGAPELPLVGSELPAVVVYDSKGRNRVSVVLTTRRVAVLNGSPRWLYFADILDIGIAPPAGGQHRHPRVRLQGREGEALMLELEPGAPFNAVSMAIQNRIEAAAKVGR